MNRLLVLVVALSGVAGAVQPGRADEAGDAAGIALFRDGRFAEAYRAWVTGAEAGDGRAARYLGVLYDTGEGVHQDRTRALSWYERAAELGDPSGMFNVAVSYDIGNGVARDRAEAARWYARAAARHFGRAEYDLALMYETGDGVRRNPAVAARLFQAAAGDGIAAAAFHLGAAHKVQVRPPPPSDDTTFLAAQRALLSRSPEDVAAAVSLFRQVASHGGATAQMAQYDLAWCTENGIGVPADHAQAYALYLRVAAGTEDPALRDLAEAGALAVRGTNAATAPAPPPPSHAPEPGTPAERPGGSSD